METGAAWQNSADASDSRVTFGYDYVADGVPEAPNTRSNDLPRTGFKLESNLSTDDFRQNLFFADPILLSPVNENFSGNYRLRFDAWSNLDTNAYYNQNRFATSEWIGGGVRYEPSDSIFDDRGVRIQGKSDGDFDIAWNLYNNGSRVDDADTFIGDAESQIPYFADFLPSTFAPSSQLGNNVGPSPVGTPAFRWLTYELAITGDTVEITLEREDGERLPIAELTLAEEALDDPRTILLLYYDGYGPSFPPNPNLQFGLIDNVVVDRLIVRGDFNESGQVEQGDLNLVLNNWGSVRGFEDGLSDFATNNVDQEELNAVLNNWGSSAVPDPQGFDIPEPVWSIAALGFVGAAVRRRGQR